MSIRIDLSNDVAMVTASSGNIGESIAACLAAAGARTVVTDPSVEAANSVAQRIRSNGGTAVGVEIDATDQSSIHDALKRAHDHFGPISLLVNNATTVAVDLAADPLSDNAFKVMDRALTGMIHVLSAILPDLIATRGTTVNVVGEIGRPTSQNAINPGSAAWAGLAEAIVSITRQTTDRGVRANVIASGTVIATSRELPLLDIDAEAHLARAYPLGRLGTPADIASAVLFLASPLSGSIAGQLVAVNGGYSQGWSLISSQY